MSTKSNDMIIFDKTSLSDIFRDIYNNSNNKREQINKFTDKLGELVNNVANASILVPLIKEYLDISVKNDEQLIKLATVVQRLISSEKNNIDTTQFGLLPEHEKRQLLEEVKKEHDDTQKIKVLEQKINVICDTYRVEDSNSKEKIIDG